MEKTFDELIENISPPYVVSDEGRALFGDLFDKPRDIFSKKELLNLMKQVREATKAEAVNINNEVVLFNMGIDLESDVDFRDSNAEILNLPTDRIKLTEKK